MMDQSPEKRTLSSSFLVLGGGIAGLNLALHLASHGPVVVLAKAQASESNSHQAQGGIAAVMDPNDAPGAHADDTITAGAGLCHPEVVHFVVNNGAKAIRRLIDFGVPFTKDPHGRYHLTREGGHSARRVIHTADATGKAVMETLMERVRHHPNIQLYPGQVAIDLITAHKIGLFVPGQPNRCYGAYALDMASGRVITYQARFTILATGGAGKVYLYTSNPDTATGDGIAMAYRAGCRVANMEFMQFHPTCLYHPNAKNFLISEAVRGEGGVLLRKDGHRFMPDHHPKAELAPRDCVARAIDAEMKRTGDPCVFLDISFKGRAFIASHFPNILAKCAAFGIAMDREPIPVVPAAHYTCGGVVTGRDARTELDGLFAVGEVSHTGLHGANRLASNSLLECLIFSDAACHTILEQIRKRPHVRCPVLPQWDNFGTDQCAETVLISHNWDEIRRFMGNYVGIVRSNRRLARARHRIELLQQEINEYYWDCHISRDLIELRNIALIASLIIRSAIHRKESRGLHYNSDYPARNDEQQKRDTVLPILS